jgi:hypothetical protein
VAIVKKQIYIRKKDWALKIWNPKR